MANIVDDPTTDETGVEIAESIELVLSFVLATAEASMFKLGATGTVAETAVDELFELI